MQPCLAYYTLKNFLQQTKTKKESKTHANSALEQLSVKNDFKKQNYFFAAESLKFLQIVSRALISSGWEVCVCAAYCARSKE